MCILMFLISVVQQCVDMSVCLCDPFTLLCVEVFCPFSLLNSNLLVNTYHNLFIHSTVDRHLGCFHFAVMITSVAITNFVHDFCCIYVRAYTCLLYIYLRMKLLVHCIDMLTYSKLFQTIFYNDYISLHFSNSIQVYKFQLPHILSKT